MKTLTSILKTVYFAGWFLLKKILLEIIHSCSEPKDSKAHVWDRDSWRHAAETHCSGEGRLSWKRLDAPEGWMKLIPIQKPDTCSLLLFPSLVFKNYMFLYHKLYIMIRENLGSKELGLFKFFIMKDSRNIIYIFLFLSPLLDNGLLEGRDWVLTISHPCIFGTQHDA